MSVSISLLFEINKLVLNVKCVNQFANYFSFFFFLFLMTRFLVTRAGKKRIDALALDALMVLIPRNTALDRYIVSKARITDRRKSIAASILKPVADAPNNNLRARSKSQCGRTLTSRPLPALIPIARPSPSPPVTTPRRPSIAAQLILHRLSLCENRENDSQNSTGGNSSQQSQTKDE